jgi:hypothetical protein
MFYTKDQINSKTICFYCSCKLTDPRSLPCGECACNECIQQMIMIDKNGDISSYIECIDGCRGVHLIPSNGFPVCKLLDSLLKETPKDVFRSDQVENLKKELEQMKTSLDEMNQLFDKGTDLITEHCSIFRNTVELKTQSLIHEIEAIKVALLLKIDDYETKCKNAYTADVTGHVNLEDFIAKKNAFYKKSQSYLDEPRIKANDTIKLHENVIRENQSLMHELRKFLIDIFMNRSLEFEPADPGLIKPSFVGTLNFKTFSFRKRLDRNKNYN